MVKSDLSWKIDDCSADSGKHRLPFFAQGGFHSNPTPTPSSIRHPREATWDSRGNNLPTSRDRESTDESRINGESRPVITFRRIVSKIRFQWYGLRETPRLLLNMTESPDET